MRCPEYLPINPDSYLDSRQRSYPERFNTRTETRIIRFNQRPFLEDPHIANACVSVLTSDGEIGTLSHLAIDHDVRQFVQDLHQLVGKNGVPVCLSGGWETFPGSNQLVEGLLKQLPQMGFLVSSSSEHSDLLGEYFRQAILFRDKVIVKREPFGDRPRDVLFRSINFSDSRELKFPRTGGTTPGVI